MSDTRRTLAIVFSDLKGFSALMAANEPAALRIVEEHNALLTEVVAAHGGRVVKFLGDGALWCFDSAADAVRAALAVQARLRARNVGAPHPILLRIGVHVGDAVLRENDVFGDGVNLAARLEPLASPGGVVVSRAVREMLRAQPGSRSRASARAR